MAWRYSPACLLFFLGTAVATPPGGPPVAPDVRIVSPTTGFATNAGVLDVAVAFEAREDGRGNVQDVDLLVDGVLAQTFRNRPDRKSGTHVFRVDLSARGEVPVRFQARAYQGNRAAGLCGVSVEVAVVVDRTPPVVAALFPADGEVVTSLRPEIGAVYGDALSGVDAASVRLFLDDRDVTPQSVVTQAAVRFVPDDDLSEGVHIVHLALSDRAGNGVEAMAAWTLVVSPPVTAGSAFLDGIVFDAATELPLQGVRVIAQGIQGAVFTDARGRFAFPAPGAGAPGAGEFLLEMTREGYHYANRRVLGTSGRDVAVEPVFLLPVGSITQISAAEGGVAASSDGSVVVTFPPGAVLHDTDVKITPILLSRDLPSLPLDNAAFVAAFFGEPSIVFERPLTVRMLNRPGLPAGTPVPIGFWDRASQEWIDGGQGRVTDDGLYIEGIWTRFSSGGFFLASLRQAGDRAWQAVETAADFAVDVGRAIADPAGFSTGFKRGDLSLAHDLPPLR
ncbi:MAG: hypothetical protein HY608_02980, partial [Planctomycetes bacterium]|nr:hypothetical protein [Planctomycetota bacterium]